MVKLFTNIFAKNVKPVGTTNQWAPREKGKAAGYTYFKEGYREDLKEYMKSKMEANVYRFYRWKVSRGDIIDVQYEPDLFKIRLGKDKITYYRPDFKVSSRKGVWYLEVKGPVDHPSLEKVRALSKSERGLKIYCIFPKQYKLIEKYYSAVIPNWE